MTTTSPLEVEEEELELIESSIEEEPLWMVSDSELEEALNGAEADAREIELDEGDIVEVELGEVRLYEFGMEDRFFVEFDGERYFAGEEERYTFGRGTNSRKTMLEGSREGENSSTRLSISHPEDGVEEYVSRISSHLHYDPEEDKVTIIDLADRDLEVYTARE